MGRNATRAQQARARVREARLLLLAERQAQDERIEEATVRTVLAWQDVVAAQERLDAAERRVGDALAALRREKVPVTQMVTLTGHRPAPMRAAAAAPRPAGQCGRAGATPALTPGTAAPPESEPSVDGHAGTTDEPGRSEPVNDARYRDDAAR